tara:strand:- start:480 stop:881 length:402 start_codon:yes stop_codon:yes gene_type:complete
MSYLNNFVHSQTLSDLAYYRFVTNDSIVWATVPAAALFCEENLLFLYYSDSSCTKIRIYPHFFWPTRPISLGGLRTGRYEIALYERSVNFDFKLAITAYRTFDKTIYSDFEYKNNLSLRRLNLSLAGPLTKLP